MARLGQVCILEDAGSVTQNTEQRRPQHEDLSIAERVHGLADMLLQSEDHTLKLAGCRLILAMDECWRRLVVASARAAAREASAGQATL